MDAGAGGAGEGREGVRKRIKRYHVLFVWPPNSETWHQFVTVNWSLIWNDFDNFKLLSFVHDFIANNWRNHHIDSLDLNVGLIKFVSKYFTPC